MPLTKLPRLDLRRTTVTVVGSSNLLDAVMAAVLREQEMGHLVLFAVYPLPGADHGAPGEITDVQQDAIREGDEVLILNVNGWVGQQTADLLAFARALGKPVRFLIPEAAGPAPSHSPGVQRLLDAVAKKRKGS